MRSKKLVLDDFLPYRLSYTSNLVSEVIASGYEALFGLKIPEWRLIAVIAESKGVTQLEIGNRTRMDKVTVSRAAVALSDRGLVDRTPHPDDGRSHLLILTREGKDLYNLVAPKALDFESRIFGHFKAQELAAFTSMLRKIDATILELIDEA